MLTFRGPGEKKQVDPKLGNFCTLLWFGNTVIIQRYSFGFLAMPTGTGYGTPAATTGSGYGTPDALKPKSKDKGFEVLPKAGLIIVTNEEVGTTPPAFSVSGGTGSTEDVEINFAALSEDAEPLDTEISSEKGTIASAAPQTQELKIEGVYFNSAAGDDTITGSSFSDFLRGGAGDDVIKCGAGDDVVRIGAGDDRLTLGDGADTLYLTADQLQGSENTLVDFDPDEDQVLIDAQLEPYISIEDVEGGVSIKLSGPKNMVGEGGVTQLLNDALTSEAISFG